MTYDDAFDFRIRPGRIRHRGGRGSDSRSFVARVMRAATKANGGPLTLAEMRGERRHGSGQKRPRKGRCSRIGRGQAVADRLKRMATERGPGQRMRRVVVKARIVRLKVASRAADAHIRYLQRDGTTGRRARPALWRRHRYGTRQGLHRARPRGPASVPLHHRSGGRRPALGPAHFQP
jgi:hypothetical protein